MYILTNKNVIMNVSKTLETQENGYYLIDNNMCIPNEFKMQDMEGNITVDKVEVYEVDEVPAEVEANKYCYTKKDGFYKNPDYKKYYSTEERLEIIEQMMNEIILGEE